MFTRFKQKYQTIFLDSNTPQTELEGKVNIILSPSLYWVKKLTLPVKYLREVKKLLPSIFEDILPDGHYSYYAYKKDNEYVVFAYEDKKILELLAAKNILLVNVANIYFAQSELDSLEGAFKISDTQSLFVKDSIVVVVPCCWIEESGELSIEEVELSKNSIVLKQFGHIVDTTSMYKAAGVLIFIGLLLSVQWFITAQKTADIVDQKEGLFAKYGLKSTTMQNEALAKKLKRIDKTQSALREDIASILKLSLQGDEKITLISYKQKRMSVSISGVKNSSMIVRKLKRDGLNVKSKLKDSELQLEISL